MGSAARERGLLTRDRKRQAALAIEGVVLLLATPFLLLPARYPALLLVMLLLLGLAWLTSWRLTRQPFPATPYNGAALLFSLSLFTAVLVTADPQITLPKATGLILGIAAWRYTVLAVQDQRRWLIALAVFLLFSAAFTALGALSAHWRFKVPLLEQLLINPPTRLLNLADGPQGGVSLNQVAGTMMLYWPLPFAILLGWRGRLKDWRFVLLALLSLSLAAFLFLTQSRAGWIGGAAGLLALLTGWGVMLPPSRRRRILLGIVGGVMGGGLFLLLLIGPTRIMDLAQEPAVETAVGNLSTTLFRQEVWRWSIAAIEDFPFTGVGLGAFRQVAFRLYPIGVPHSYDFAHAHNIFLQTALDVGLPGLIAYLALVGTAVAQSWQKAKRGGRGRPFYLALFAGLIALHVYGLGDALALGSKTNLLFWLALGLISCKDD
jgi:putative inorganic carbon (hco3(-)) transporter